MLKKALLVSLVVSLFLSFSLVAIAHDGWTQTNAPIIEAGEVSYVDILLGNHSNEHRSYRIDGQFSTNSTVNVTTPAGQKVDITSTRFYTGEPDSTNKLNNGFVASFTASQYGAYIITAESESIRSSAGQPASRTLRNAKSFVAALDIPSIARAQQLSGFSKVINKDRAELIPQFNPAAVITNQEVSVHLLLKGAPLADTEVSLIRRSINTDPQTIKTDANGVAKFKVGAADYYLFRAKPSTTEADGDKYASTNYETTMTIKVQNGVARKSSITQQPTQIVVNGKVVTPKRQVNNRGTLTVDSSFIKQHIDRTHRNQGVSMFELRKTAISLGAQVEFLPAVHGAPPTVLIYTK
jgi:uncharacterized GH25 family protein